MPPTPMQPTPQRQGWHCSECDVIWPFYGNYQKCRICSDQCDHVTGFTPLTVPQAEHLLNEYRAEAKAAATRQAQHSKFNEWYAEQQSDFIEKEMAAFFEAWETAEGLLD